MLKRLKELLAAMKRIEKDGFPDEGDAKSYFEEKEEVLEEIGKVLGELETSYSEEIEAMKATIKTLRDSLKDQADSPRVLTVDEFYLNLGKTIAGVWLKNQQMLGELHAVPNYKNESWVNPKDVNWAVGKGWVGKAPLDTPMGDMATNDQYLINPIYENKIMT
ncbi:MAG: phage major capsid protein, partial [Spirochaetales bacterium]|nr:phage major capsid protein [Spirochaetales bacterium]